MINVNCGVLGHVDSGKTSLCRYIHHVASTASMDKNPQSQSRGITIDLGFSSLILPPNSGRTESLQVTLIDCPGHSGLIRTVLNGARIVDMCLLIVDVSKGFQTQTAECLIIAEILSPKLIVVVNKVDLIPDEKRNDVLHALLDKIRKTMAKTRFSMNVMIKCVSALAGDGIPELIQGLSDCIGSAPLRNGEGPLHFAYDHCFAVKGQGTIFTGTVLNGTLKQGDRVFIPSSNESGDVKSIQSFRKSVTRSIQGDRIGICIPGINPSGKERGEIYASKNDIRTMKHAVFFVRKIPYFKQSLGKGKLHLSIGNLHTMGTPFFFCKKEALTCPKNLQLGSRGSSTLIADLEEDLEKEGSIENGFHLIDDVDSLEWMGVPMYCLIIFQSAVKISPRSILVASKLDLEENYSGCRLAFFGKQVHVSDEVLCSSVTRTKRKEGIIDRFHGSDTCCLVKGIMKKGDVGCQKYLEKQIKVHESDVCGIIEGSFGKSGLLRVRMSSSIDASFIGSPVTMDWEKPAFSKLILS